MRAQQRFSLPLPAALVLIFRLWSRVLFWIERGLWEDKRSPYLLTTSPTDAGAPETGRDSHLIGLEEAAELLGLAPSFLQWALESGLMKGEMDGKGRWTLPRSEISAGLELLDARAEESPVTTPPATVAEEVQDREAFALKAPCRPATTDRGQQNELTAPKSDQEPAAGKEVEDLLDEIRFLRQLVRDRDAALVAKDQVIAKLSLEITRLAETAMSRLPRG